MTISVLIVDDQELVRAGFRKLLDSDDNLRVVGDASDGIQALAECRRLRPDVVLMDIRMPNMDGIQATQQLGQSPDTSAIQVLILTTYDLDEYVFDALRAGASGFLLKDSPPDALIAAISTVARGDALLAPSVTRRLIAEFARRPAKTAGPVLTQLSPREREVLALVASGLSNHDIAAELFLSEATIKTHVGSILTKLGCRDRVQAVVAAYEAGLVEPGHTHQAHPLTTADSPAPKR
jgi:DNA-binding NarL/FixJ family response regulator